MYLLDFVIAWVSLVEIESTAFFSFIAYHWFSMMPSKRESTFKGGFPYSTAIIPEGSGRLGSHGLDVNFIFRPFKRRKKLPESSKALNQRTVESQNPTLHLYKSGLTNCKLHGNPGVTNNATNTPLTAMKMDRPWQGPVSGRRVAIKGALADFSGVRAPRDPAWCWGVQLPCGQITAHIRIISSCLGV